MIASACVIGVAAVVREVWIPQFQDRLERNPQDLKADVTRPVQVTQDSKLCVLLEGKHLSPVGRILTAPVIRIQPGPLAGVGRKILATVPRRCGQRRSSCRLFAGECQHPTQHRYDSFGSNRARRSADADAQ